MQKPYDILITTGKRDFHFPTLAENEAEAVRHAEYELGQLCLKFSGLFDEIGYPFKIKVVPDAERKIITSDTPTWQR